jgi:membrane protease YdiL (CAAX protease family)
MSEARPPRPDLIRAAGERLPVPDLGEAQTDGAAPPPATWRPLEAIPVFFIATAVTLVVGVPLAAVRHFCGGQAVIGTFVGELAFGVAVLLWVRYVNHGPVEALGLPRRPLGDVGAGLLTGVLLIVAGSVALYAVRSLVSLVIGHEPSTPEQVMSCVRGSALNLLGPVVILVAPFGEELFFRGLLYKGLRRSRSVAVSVAISSGAFGLVHVYPVLILPLAVVGAGLAIVYERRQSLLASMVAHATFNLLGFITILMSRT